MAHRTVTHFFDDMLNAIEAIERFVAHMSYDDFTQDPKTIRAIEREFEILGEAVKHLPTSMTEKYPDVPWRLVAGMRDRLIHHYWETETAILWKTIHESVPPLRDRMTRIRQQELMEEEEHDDKSVS